MHFIYTALLIIKSQIATGKNKIKKKTVIVTHRRRSGEQTNGGTLCVTQKSHFRKCVTLCVTSSVGE